MMETEQHTTVSLALEFQWVCGGELGELWRRLAKAQERGAVLTKALGYTVARSLYIDDVRKATRVRFARGQAPARFFSLDDPDVSPRELQKIMRDPHSQPDRQCSRWTVEEIMAAFDRLPPTQRRLALARYVHDVPTDEIAKAENKKIKLVQCHLAYARRTLQRVLRIKKRGSRWQSR